MSSVPKSILLKAKVQTDIREERDRQDEKWGVQRHDLAVWMTILMEEVGELAQAVQRDRNWGKESDAGDTYKEAIQVSAVAAAIAEQVREHRESSGDK